MSRRTPLTESQLLAAWGVFSGVVLAYFVWVGHSLPLAMGVLMVLTILQPWTWPGIQHEMSTTYAKLIRGTFNWVWLIAAVGALGFGALRWKAATTAGGHANVVFWSLCIPFAAAFIVRWVLRRDLVEKSDRRQMTLFIESTYSIERTNKWGVTRTVGYLIRTAEYGEVKVSSDVYHKLLPNRKVVLIASTVFGLRVHRVVRMACVGDD